MTSRLPLRTALVAAAVAGAVAIALTIQPQEATSSPSGPTDQVGTWGTAADVTSLALADQTVRNIVSTSVGGSNLRVSLSNAFGSRAVTFDSVWAGTAGTGAAVVAGTNRRVTFSGSTDVTVPPGAEVLSDPLPGEVPARSTLAVSIHVVGDAGTVSGHRLAHQTSWISTAGDHAQDESSTAYATPTTSWAWVEALVVETPEKVDTVVAFGDSITDGDRSTPGANRRWPDLLAERLLREPTPKHLGVMNAGISGNRVLTDGSGVSAQARFDRDVLAQPDVRTVVLMEGVNDLRWDLVTTADDLIGPYRQLVARAHARGVCVVGGTITPWEGGSRWSPAKDDVRVAVNGWIRSSDELDAVVDFDSAIRDPRRPSRMLPAYDSGDHLHPGDAGYAAMAAAVDLDGLECRRDSSTP